MTLIIEQERVERVQHRLLDGYSLYHRAPAADPGLPPETESPGEIT